MAVVFDIDQCNVNNSTAAMNVEKWDSLTHFIMIVSLEQKFNITYTDEEIATMINFKNIVEITYKKIQL